MSFILDALRRAQNVNEHATTDSAPIYADRVPDAPADLHHRILIIAAALATLCAVALLAWWFGRESATPQSAAQPPVATASVPRPAPRATPPIERAPVRALDQEAARGRPAMPVEPAPTATGQRATKVTPGTVTVMPSRGTTATPAPTTQAEIGALPQYENLLLDGKINLPNLKMDMHVYNRQPAKRFVFINFKKYREGDTLDRNTAIEEITARGAVLNYNGERFLLQPN